MRFGLTALILLPLELHEPIAPPPVTTAPRWHDGVVRITEPRKTKDVPPKWPANALRAGLDGSVVLECTLAADGSVRQASVLRGPLSLAEAAAEAVLQWRYIPTIDGRPLRVMTVTVNFRLDAPPKRDDVLASLADPDPEIRCAAVRWLAEYRPVTAEQKAAVQSALRDSDKRVRNAAKRALEALGMAEL